MSSNGLVPCSGWIPCLLPICVLELDYIKGCSLSPAPVAVLRCSSRCLQGEGGSNRSLGWGRRRAEYWLLLGRTVAHFTGGRWLSHAARASSTAPKITFFNIKIFFFLVSRTRRYRSGSRFASRTLRRYRGNGRLLRSQVSTPKRQPLTPERRKRQRSALTSLRSLPAPSPERG